MTEDQVRNALLDVLREVSEAGGHTWGGVDPSAKPIGALDDFDSLSAIEATVMIEEKLSCNIPLDSIFVSHDGNRALTVQEIVTQLMTILADHGGTI